MRSSQTRTLLGFLALVFVLGGTTVSAFAQLHWAIAKRSDEEIQTRVEKLMKRIGDTPGADTAAAVVLEKGHNYRLEKKPPEDFTSDQSFRFLAPKLCLNRVILVRDPATLPGFVTQPYTIARGELVEVAAFHLRKDKMTRLKDSSWEVEKSDGHIRRGRVVFQFPELKEGDIVGYSLVTEGESPLLAASVAAADRAPVLYYSLRILANGAVNYNIHSEGFPEMLKAKTAEPKNARPSAWQISSMQIAAHENLPLSGPYPDHVPHFGVNAKEIFFESPMMGVSEWSGSSGWNYPVTLVANGDEQLETDGMDIRTSVITTNATTDDEKIQAICEYVRDELKLLEGDQYDEWGVRESARDILGSGEATPIEKVFLALAMLKSKGVQAHLVMARPNSYGSVDENRSPLLQFPKLLVRVPGEMPRYYAPQCTDCSLGTLPPEWNGAMLLVPQIDIAEVAEAFMADYMQEAMTQGRMSPADLTRAMEAEKWYSLETVGPAVGGR